MVMWLLAVLVGAVIVFVWGSVSWMALGWHHHTMAGLPDGERLVPQLTNAGLKPGLYVWPMMPAARPDATPAETKAMMADFETQHRHGPVIAMFSRDGSVPFGPKVLLGGFVADLIAATVLGWVLCLAAQAQADYLHRVALGTALGVFAGSAADLKFYVWMNGTALYTWAMIRDHVIGWTLAALAMAAMIQN